MASQCSGVEFSMDAAGAGQRPRTRQRASKRIDGGDGAPCVGGALSPGSDLLKLTRSALSVEAGPGPVPCAREERRRRSGLTGQAVEANPARHQSDR